MRVPLYIIAACAAVVVVVLALTPWVSSSWETRPLSTSSYTVVAKPCSGKPGDPVPAFLIGESYNSVLHVRGSLYVQTRVSGKPPVVSWSDLNQDPSVNLADRSWNPSTDPSITASIQSGGHTMTCILTAGKKK